MKKARHIPGTTIMLPLARCDLDKDVMKTIAVKEKNCLKWERGMRRIVMKNFLMLPR
ncbi:hypothetical protein NDK25_11750 [Niallia taxi]|nr:hypothetical protein [Niallia taxi]MDE5052907.1 hypothetical protein [Niallia taxi]